MAEHGYRSSIDGGVVVNGKYQLCAKLGHGSFGDIYKGLSLHIEVRCVTEKRRGSSPPSQTQGLTLRLERRLASSLSMSAAVDRSCSTSLMSWHCLRATVCSTHPFFFFFLATTCTHALTGAANSGLCARHLVRDTGRLPRTRHGPARAEPVPAHGLLRRTLLAQDRADVGRANGLQICRIKTFA